VRYKITILFILIARFSFAQKMDTIQKCDWTPVFENDLPKKFFYIKTEGPFQYQIKSESDVEEIGNGSAEITSNPTVTARLKFPILNKNRAILTGGIRYTNEQFYFDHSKPSDYPMYTGLHNRNLRKLGLDFKGMFHLKGNRSIVMQTAWDLAGDFHLGGEKYFKLGDLLKSSLALGYAIRKDANTYYAFGAYFGYTFGDPSLYPVFNYSKRFNNNVGIDVLLPQGLKVWKKLNNNFYLLGAAEISGTSYTVRVDDSILSEAESVQLRQSTIDATVGVLARINKWVGVEARFGYSNNLNFNVSESNFIPGSTLPKPDTDYLIKSDVAGAPYYSFSVFLAVPKDLMKRFVD
jgi:hypothetical protein